MPQVNVPLGLYGIFISALDPSLVTIPAVPPTNPSQGVWEKAVAANVYVNLTKFLQQFASSPNASLGGQHGANLMTGFDIVFSGPSGLVITPQMFETNFVDGVIPIVKSAGTTQSLVLQVAKQPTLPTPANAASIIRWTLGFPPGTGYWLIGQNNADCETHLEIAFSAAVQLFGIGLFFGSR